MRDLFKITQEDQTRINELVPDDNIGTLELYQKPALEEFQVEYHADNDCFSTMFFKRINEDFANDVKIKSRTGFMLDPSAAVICVETMHLPGWEVLETATVFGYNTEKQFACFSPVYQDEPEMNEFMCRHSDAITWLYDSIQYLLLHHRELLTFSVTKEPNKHSGKKKKGGKAKKSPPKKTRLYRLVHLTDEQTEELKKTIHDEHEKRKIERHCTAWGVRGHYRHYKSGKVAYIKPHVRGKEKESYQGREYVLLPKDIIIQQTE